MWQQVRKRLFGLSTAEATFARRGFVEDTPASRMWLERIGQIFLDGYHAALAEDQPDPLGQQLVALDPVLRGFAFEGAAMALTLLDLLTAARFRRLKAFLAGPGTDHIYMIHVGAGWALARLHFPVAPALAHFDPLLRWLALDGYGFHQGYFNWPRYVTDQKRPRLSGYAAHAFDQGLGRSLWFVGGAGVVRVTALVTGFPVTRQSDLWSGVGLACAYAGGIDAAAIAQLQAAAGRFGPQLAQGAAFAAAARRRAGNPAAHTELACRILCGVPAGAAADVTDAALQDLPITDQRQVLPPAYEIWRQRIQTTLNSEAVIV